jgi:hypothetical protein
VPHSYLPRLTEKNVPVKLAPGPELHVDQRRQQQGNQAIYKDLLSIHQEGGCQRVIVAGTSVRAFTIFLRTGFLASAGFSASFCRL